MNVRDCGHAGELHRAAREPVQDVRVNVNDSTGAPQPPREARDLPQRPEPAALQFVLIEGANGEAAPRGFAHCRPGVVAPDRRAIAFGAQALRDRERVQVPAAEFRGIEQLMNERTASHAEPCQRSRGARFTATPIPRNNTNTARARQLPNTTAAFSITNATNPRTSHQRQPLRAGQTASASHTTTRA